MRNRTEEWLWMIVAGGIAAAAARLFRFGLKRGWKALYGEEAPSNPASRDVPWGRALLWGLCTGAAVGVTRVVARRGATAGWVRLLGRKPPGV